MRVGVLVREAIRSAAASRVPTALVALLVAAMCLTTILTVGRAAAAQQQVQQRLEDAGSRLLQVTDAKSLGFLTAATVDQAAGLSTTERVLGVTVPQDVTSTAVGGGTPVPAWQVLGDLHDAVELVAGRWPAVGEALVASGAQDTLGLDVPVGAVSTSDGRTTLAVVGAFRARAPFTDFDAGLVAPAAPGVPAHSMRVIAQDAASSGITQAGIVALLARRDPADLSIVSPTTLADLQGEVVGDLARYNRTLLVAVMAAGAFLVSVVSAADVLLRRRDLGRRRALGAPRWALTVLVVVRATCGGLIGATLASALGLILTARTGQAPPLAFVAGTAALGVLAAAVSSVPPAIAASRQDPVRVLRTP